MTIKFYNVTDDRRQLVKTLIDTGSGKNLKATLSGNIKNDTSILDIVLEVKYNSDLMTANYMYIPDLNRYYFINNIEVSTQRLFIKAHVDVLMSYHDDIDQLVCVVSRQEHKFNLYLNDGIFRVRQDKEVRTIVFPKSFYRNCSFVLTVGGN